MPFSFFQVSGLSGTEALLSPFPQGDRKCLIVVSENHTKTENEVRIPFSKDVVKGKRKVEVRIR